MDNAILFNALKHHWITIKQYVSCPPPQWSDDLLAIGHSLIDLYMGNLSLKQISDECIQKLQQLNVLSLDAYESWLHVTSGYRLISLSDCSVWTLRRSKANDVQYIHIHPARNSPLTVRVKSETLKTAIAYHCIRFYEPLRYDLLSQWPGEIEITATLNFVRQSIQLSPVKKVERHGKMCWLIRNLNSN